MTLRRAIVRWFIYARIGKAKTTKVFYRETALTLLRECRHSLKLSVADLTDERLLSIAARIGHYSPARWNAFVQCLRWITPAAKCLKRRQLKMTRQPPPSQQQFAALLAAADRLAKSKARLVIEFLAHTGLRITAARNVRWSDVFYDRIEYISKGGRRCSVPIINGLAEVLERLRSIKDESGYVLPRECIIRGLRKACDQAGIRRLNHHDFRHLFITRCIESGVPVPIVARWVGHRDGGALLQKRYYHLTDAHSIALAKQVRI